MNLKSTLSFSVFIILACLASSAQALIVTFDRSAANPNLGREDALNVDTGTPTVPDINIFGGVTPSSTFSGIPDTSDNAIALMKLTPDAGGAFDGYAEFGDTGGITFLGGAVLENPTQTDAIQFASGTILYGTAFAPNTGGAVPPTVLGLTNQITIDIDLGEQITSVEGLLINGLNTTGQTFLADYMVEYFVNEDTTPISTQSIDDLPSNRDQGNAIFEFASSMDDFITQVVITGIEQNFGTEESPSLEWDFFIDSIAFNEAIENVIPIPAALPLFLSALLGGWMFARPRRSRAN